MTRLTDDDVTGLIKHLPRFEASDDFTRRVMEKLDRAQVRRSRRRTALGAALAFTVALGAFGAWLGSRYESSRAAARVEALRQEYRALQDELRELRALAAEIEPVLELGGTEEVDFVFDLREVDPAYQEPVRGAQPVSHEEPR